MSSDLQADIQVAYKKLREIRLRKDLKIKPNVYLRTEYTAADGTVKPVRLRYYQVQMVLHLLVMQGFVVGDDTGLGKTVETISALCHLWAMYPDKKAVVMAKKSAAFQWSREFTKFTTGVNVFLAVGTAAERKAVYTQFEQATGPSVLVFGYRSAVRDIKEIQDWEKYVLVTDEATVYKNPSTQIHQLVSHMGSKAERHWALTATLIKNNLMEGYGIYQCVVPGLFRMTKNAFMTDYCVTTMQTIGRGRRVPKITGYTREAIDRFKAKIDPFYLGRPKHAVADELPVLTTRDIEVGMTGFQAQLYQEALEGLIRLGTGEVKEAEALTSIIYCQEIVNHPCLLGHEDAESEKMDTLVDLLTDGGEFEDQKVIIYTRFRRLVDFAVPHLEKLGVRCVRVTGAEDEAARQAAMDQFQDVNSGVNVIWITDAGGDSINLQAAKALIFYDTPWSAGDYLQVLGRMIRIGSIHDRVYALHLIVKGTIDRRVQQVKNKKMKLIEAVLGARIKGEDTPDMFPVGSERNDLYEFLLADARAAA